MTNQQTKAIEAFRKKATFSPYLMTCFLKGGEENVQKQREAWSRAEKALSATDSWKLPRRYGNQDRTEQIQEGLEESRVMFEDQVQHGHQLWYQMTYNYQLGNARPFSQSTLIFLPCLQYLASPEQAAVWVPQTMRGEMIGTYCQTELGHGTFIRGLETTATYDKITQQFILHSPTVTSTKFWPGALGHSTTHAVVMAQLYIEGKNLGFHAFLVQVRSLKDFKPLPGIELGDIGLKLAYNHVDNGYLRFNQVRIPRTAMLNRHSQVHADGRYTSTDKSRVKYTVMLKLRGVITSVVAYGLAQAVTIATRYSIVRLQGFGPNGSLLEETLIYHYKSQHSRLLTLIAKAYAIFFVGRALDAEILDHLRRISTGDHCKAPAMHALSAGCKAWASQIAADGADDARRLCGGQGYLSTSGLPDIAGHLHGPPTFEGENFVLWQQVFRSLLKCVRNLQKAQPTPMPFKYIAQGFKEYHIGGDSGSATAAKAKCVASGIHFLDPTVQLSIYRHRALRLVYSTSASIFEDSIDDSPITASKAWNRHMMSIIDAARAHVEYEALELIYAQLCAITDKYEPLRPVLTRVVNLYALSTIISPTSTSAITWVEDGYLSLSQINNIRQLVDDLLKELYHDATALTDAWDFSDASLCSAIGCYDGNAYERLLAWTRQLPMNVNANKTGGVYEKGWKEVIQPMIAKTTLEKAKL